MLGQRTARLEPAPRRWIQRALGYPEIHSRQKWSALWPHLASLPHEGVRLLDAGCGTGRWSLDLASRRPKWSVVGVDIDKAALEKARLAKARLGLDNVSFLHTDFREFRADGEFDVVLSVASLHYMVASGEAHALFGQFSRWLKPGGRLLVLTPRRAVAALFFRGLPQPDYKGTSTAQELTALCQRHGFRVDHLAGAIGRFGVLAKQLSWQTGPWLRPFSVAAYPVPWLLASLDRVGPTKGGGLTLMWVLVAQLVENQHATDPGPAA